MATENLFDQYNQQAMQKAPGLISSAAKTASSASPGLIVPAGASVGTVVSSPKTATSASPVPGGASVGTAEAQRLGDAQRLADVNKAEGVSSTPPPAPEKTTKTTSNQDWAKGHLKVGDKGAYFTPAGSKKQPASANAGPANAANAGPANATASHLEGLLASESPYMTLAKSQAAQAANAKGLLNSSMATTAGEYAAIQSALPIAQQDAQYEQQKALYETQGGISANLANINAASAANVAGISAASAANVAGINAASNLALTKTEIAGKSALSKQDAAQVQALSKLQAGQNLTLQETKNAGDLAVKQAQIAYDKIDLQARVDMDTKKMDLDTKKTFTTTFDSISQDFMKDYEAILIDPNFKTPQDRQVALDVLTSNTEQRYKILGQISNVDLKWEIPKPTATSSTSTTTPYTPPEPAPAPVTPPSYYQPPWTGGPGEGGGGPPGGEGPGGQGPGVSV